VGLLAEVGLLADVVAPRAKRQPVLDLAATGPREVSCYAKCRP